MTGGAHVAVSRANAPHYLWGGGACDGWRMLDRPDLSVTAERMPAGTSETPHRHANARQYFFVLKGELTIRHGETATQLGPQDGLEIAPGTPHTAINESAAAVEFLVISAPSTRTDREELS